MIGHDGAGRHAQVLARYLLIRQHTRSNIGHQAVDHRNHHAGNNNTHGDRSLGVLGNRHHTHRPHSRALAGPAHNSNGAEDACKATVTEATIIRSTEEILYIDMGETDHHKQHQCTHQKDGCNVLEPHGFP